MEKSTHQYVYNYSRASRSNDFFPVVQRFFSVPSLDPNSRSYPCPLIPFFWCLTSGWSEQWKAKTEIHYTPPWNMSATLSLPCNSSWSRKWRATGKLIKRKFKLRADNSRLEMMSWLFAVSAPNEDRSFCGRLSERRRKEDTPGYSLLFGSIKKSSRILRALLGKLIFLSKTCETIGTDIGAYLPLHVKLPFLNRGPV